MTLLEVTAMFSTDEKCREMLKRLRWPSGVECPRCKMPAVELATARELFYCGQCDYQFSATAGTIFNDSLVPLDKWFATTYLICESKKGISANQIRNMLWGKNKGSYKTAWFLCHRIRAAMSSAERPMLDGTVEMDETYVGGKERYTGTHWKNTGKKQVVIGIRQRGGDLRFFHAEDARTGTLEKYIKENISTDVDVIVTDELPAYRKAVGDNKHETVNHSAKEYVRFGTDIHTNTVESAFSLFKRGIIGSWHKISAKHLPAYLAEMEFRFNRRKRSDLFIDTLRHMVTADPLTFERLTKEPAA